MTMDHAPPTGATWLTTWTASPVANLLIALVFVGYLALLIRRQRQRKRWPLLRTLAALAATLVLVLVVNSSLAVYSHQPF